MIPRIIPVLLINKGGLYKTVRFKNPKYVGDPVNAIRVFNNKFVDEIIVLDYNATIEKRNPDFGLLEDMASQCFMPLCYGGGIRSTDDISKIIQCGVEKIALNSEAFENYRLVEDAAKKFGSSSVVLSVDVRENMFGEYQVVTHSATKATGLRPDLYAKQMEDRGIGEILVNSVNLDGTMKGYDLRLIKLISGVVNVPVIACGGAGDINHLKEVYDAGATAMAAGSMFIFHGKHRGVLINYPDENTLNSLFRNNAT